jgi:hypothetical protein
MGLSTFEEVNPLVQQTQILAATGTNLAGVLSGSPRSQRIDSMWAVNTDTIAHVVNVWTSYGGINYLLGSVNLPIGTGIAPTPPIDLLVALFGAGNPGICLSSTSTLSVSAAIAVGGAFAIFVTSLGGQL